MPHPFFTRSHPLVIGHRGAAGSAPENTVESFERAIALGADVLESDVHATRDRVAVLTHDASLGRMTGAEGDVGDYELAALQRLDAAFAFAGADEDFPLRDQGIRIPTLDEAFARFPEALFNLEIKDEAEGLVEDVLALVAKHDRADRTLLTAEKDPIMVRIRSESVRANVPTAIGASVADVLAYVRAAVAKEAPETDSMALQIPTEFGGHPLVTPELIQHAHAHGTQVHAWTINEVPEMERLLAMGIDGIVTDHPERLVALLAQRAPQDRSDRR